MIGTAPRLLLLHLLLGSTFAPHLKQHSANEQQHSNLVPTRQNTVRRAQARVGAYEPVQVHLGYTGENADSVIVQWVTRAMAERSYVKWWAAGTEGTPRRADANSTECGPQHPVYSDWTGVLHQARMGGTVSRQTYYYRVGSDEDLSPQRSFTVPGYAESEATMLVAADISTSENALLLWAQLRQEVATADVLMLAGGTAYAGVSPEEHGSQETWDTFFEQAREVLTLLPVSVAVGTHDSYSDPPFRPFYLRFPMGPSARSISADGRTSGSMAGFPNWYAYYMGPMRVVVVSTEHCTTSPTCAVQDAAVEKEQLVWLDTELGAADARRTTRRPWVVLVGHRPLYSSSSEHSPGDNQLRALMEPLIFRHGVDLALWGHTRQYERTWPVWAERVMFRGASTSAANDNGVDEHRQENPDISTGPVHVNVGPGGAPGNNSGWRHYPWVAKTAQPEWSPGGYLKVRADSVCGLKIQYAGLDGDIQDEFALSKVPTEPPIELDIDLITWGDLAWDVWDKFEDPGQNWNKLDISNNLVSVGWKLSKTAPLGFGDSPASIIGQDAVGYFFRKVVSLSTLECYENFTISFQRDDGAVIFVNGYELGRSNMPDGPVNFVTQADTQLSGEDESQVVSLTFNASTGHLRPGLNVIGASVHQFGTSNDLRFDLRFAARKQHPCIPQEIVDDCSIAQALAAIVPEPEPEIVPPPPPAPLPPEPISSDVVIVSVTLALCGVGAVAYVSYQIKQCTQKKVEVTKKQKRVREVKVMSSQKEAALLAAKMTDAKDLSQAGKHIVIAGKDKKDGIKMSYAHAENMKVKAGDVFEGVSSDGRDAWSELPQQRSNVQFAGGAAAGVGSSYQPGSPVALHMIARMKKKDLVAELRQRGLPVSGSTPQLQSRLVKVVEVEEKKAAAKAEKKAAKAAAKAEKLERKRRAREEASSKSSLDEAP